MVITNSGIREVIYGDAETAGPENAGQIDGRTNTGSYHTLASALRGKK